MSKPVNVATSRVAATSVAGNKGWVTAAIVPFLLGGVIVYGMGFAPGRLHGAAHDSRHSIGLVCH